MGFDRDTALAVLKELSRCVYPSNDPFGTETLVIDRHKYELIRHKYLDKKISSDFHPCHVYEEIRPGVFARYLESKCEYIEYRVQGVLVDVYHRYTTWTYDKNYTHKYMFSKETKPAPSGVLRWHVVICEPLFLNVHLDECEALVDEYLEEYFKNI